jgi:hypothetical protein
MVVRHEEWWVKYRSAQWQRKIGPRFDPVACAIL